MCSPPIPQCGCSVADGGVCVLMNICHLGLTECIAGRKKYQCRIYGKRQWVIKLRKSAIDDAVKRNEDQGILPENISQ